MTWVTSRLKGLTSGMGLESSNSLSKSKHTDVAGGGGYSSGQEHLTADRCEGLTLTLAIPLTFGYHPNRLPRCPAPCGLRSLPSLLYVHRNHLWLCSRPGGSLALPELKGITSRVTSPVPPLPARVCRPQTRSGWLAGSRPFLGDPAVLPPGSHTPGLLPGTLRGVCFVPQGTAVGRLGRLGRARRASRPEAPSDRPDQEDRARFQTGPRS